MTLINNAEIKCPKCGKVFKVPFYQSINVTLDPELKKKVLDDSINTFECPNCEFSPIGIPEPFAYHDMIGRFYLTLYHETLIFRWPECELATQLQNKKIQEIFQNQDKRIFDFKTRIVFGRNYLKEKIYIFDSDFDDFSITMLKIRVLQELKNDDIAHFIFLQYNPNDKVLEFAVYANSQWRQYSVPLEVYSIISEIHKEESQVIKDCYFIDFRRYVGPISEKQEEIQNQFKNFKLGSWLG